MQTVTIEGEQYRIVVNDHQTLSAVRADGERKVVVLNWNKATGEIERRARICQWLNQDLREEEKRCESISKAIYI